MKRMLGFALALAVAAAMLVGCTSEAASSSGGTNTGLGDFYTAWSGKLEALAETDMTEEAEVAEGMSTLVEQAKEWDKHVSGDTATIGLPSETLTVSATGAGGSLASATIECAMGDASLTDGVTPEILLFTLGGGAIVEVISGEDDKGLETVNQAVSALLSGTADNGVITSDPVTVGKGSFVVSLDTSKELLSLTGTPQ